MPVVRNVSTQLRQREAQRRDRVRLRAETVARWPRWRRLVHEFVRGAPFERFVFLLIILNSIAISTQNIKSFVAYSAIFTRLEEICTVLFVVEMILKLIGLGVFVKRVSYFSSTWNIIDFVITVVSIGALIGSWANSSDSVGIGVARSFRLLRPVRFFSVLSSLRLVLRAIAASLIRLGNVFVLSIAFLAFMALVGLQFFSGALSARCVELLAFNMSTENGSLIVAPPFSPNGGAFGSVQALEAAAASTCIAVDLGLAFVLSNGGDAPCCLLSSSVATNPLLLNLSAILVAAPPGGGVGQTLTPEGILDRASGLFRSGLDRGLVVGQHQLPSVSSEVVCPYGQYCLLAESPSSGQLGFRDVLGTVVLLYTVISLDGWSSEMFYVMDSRGMQVPIYFSVLVIIGTIFILNLALAIISDAFSRQLEFESSFLRKQKRIEGKSGLFVTADGVLGPAAISDRATSTDVDPLDSTRRSGQAALLGSSAVRDDRGPTEAAGRGWTGMFMTPGLLELATPRPKTLQEWVSYCRRFAAHSIFPSLWYEALLNTAALVNGVMLATAHAGMPLAQAEALRTSNSVFTLIFGLDVLLHLAAVGPREYFVPDSTRASHLFDAAAALGSAVEYFFFQRGTAVGSLRLLRLSTWFRFFPSIQSSVDRLFTSLRETLSLLLFTVITLYMFALLGTVLFAGTMCNLDTTSTDRVNTSLCDNVPRANFDNVGYSLLSVFTILAGDGWKSIMINEMLGTGNPYVSLYFCLCYLVTGYLVLNMFVAILIANFATQNRSAELMGDDEELEFGSAGAAKRAEQSIVLSTSKSLFALRGAQKHHRYAQDRGRSQSVVSLSRPLLQQAALPEPARGSDAALPAGALHIDYSLLDSSGHLRLSEAELASLAGTDKTWESERDGGSGQDDEVSLDSVELMNSFDIVHTKSDVGASIAQRRKEIFDKIKFEEGKKSAPRFIAGSVVKSRRFKGFYLLVIFFSNVTLIVSRPTDYPDSSASLFQRISDVVLSVLFVVEAGLKMLYLGPHHPKGLVLKGYFNYRWNIFDFVLTLCTVGSCVSLGAAGNPVLQELAGWLRVTRCLRPLSLLGTNDTLAVVFRSMFASIPRIRNVGVVLILVWVAYAVLGLQLFAGRFGACSTNSEKWGDMSFSGLYLTQRDQCLAANYSWLSAPRNFDSLGDAMLTMFQVATADNWDTIMYTGVDSADDETAPIPRNRSAVYLYFVSYIVVMTYFLLNVFVSVMVDAYFVTKGQMVAQRRHTLLHNHEATLDHAQEDFSNMYRRALYFVKPPLRTTGKTTFFDENAGFVLLSRALRRILRVRYFEAVYVSAVGAHIALMATQYMTSPPFDYTTLMIVDVLFNTLFVGVGTLRVVVVGWRSYFASTRNRWEFAINTVTTSSLIARIAAEGSSIGTGGVATIDMLRSMRIFRLFRIAYMSTSMRLLIATVVHSAPKFLVVAFFVLEIFFVYAVLGMKLFGRVRFRDSLNRAYLGRYANFEKFDSALICLLRVATLDDWTELMNSCAITEANGECDSNLGECGLPGVAQLYFMSFVLFGQWLGINFFTAEIMDAFSSSEREERYMVQRRDVQRFQQLWKAYSNPNELMSVTNLQRFVVILEPPIGPVFPRLATPSPSPAGEDRPPAVDAQLVRSFLAGLDVLTVDNCVAQGDIFDALLRHLYGVELPTVFDNELRALMVSRFQMHDIERVRRRQQHQFVVPSGQQPALGTSGGSVKLCEAVSALIIQSRWRGAKIRKVVRSAMARLVIPHIDHRDQLTQPDHISFAALSQSFSPPSAAVGPSAAERASPVMVARGEDSAEMGVVLEQRERERIKKEYLARHGARRRANLEELL